MLLGALVGAVLVLHDVEGLTHDEIAEKIEACTNGFKSSYKPIEAE